MSERIELFNHEKCRVTSKHSKLLSFRKNVRSGKSMFSLFLFSVSQFKFSRRRRVRRSKPPIEASYFISFNLLSDLVTTTGRRDDDGRDAMRPTFFVKIWNFLLIFPRKFTLTRKLTILIESVIYHRFSMNGEELDDLDRISCQS